MALDIYFYFHKIGKPMEYKCGNNYLQLILLFVYIESVTYIEARTGIGFECMGNGFYIKLK